MSRLWAERNGIEQNVRKQKEVVPTIVVRHNDGTTTYHRHVLIRGPSEMRFGLDGPPEARVWVETDAEIVVVR